MRNNICLMTDSYKASHYLQYPEGTTEVYSYVESRGGKYPATVFFGLQMFIKEYLTDRVTRADVIEAKEFFAAHGEPFNYDGWMYIVNELDGNLPVEIRAVPEGMVVPVSNVLATIRNTDPKCFWLTSYLETALLRSIWYPTTVATQSKYCKETILEYLRETSDVVAEEEALFKLHDFGARGVSSAESARVGGAAHLVNFLGSDTVEGVRAASYYYGEPMAGFSVPAAEHSTMTLLGPQGEAAAFKNMLDKFGGKDKLVAVVSDSYDIYNAVENIWGKELKDEVLAMGGTLVVRPDSGYPPAVVERVLVLLAEAFGTTVNSKGYKVLNPAVRVLQGDGINHEMIVEILDVVKRAGFSTENVGFGMGGGLLQQVNRDTQAFAMKASFAIVNGKEYEVFKKPVTSDMKASKKGKLTLSRTKEGTLKTIQFNGAWQDYSLMPCVFKNGRVGRVYTFEEVRANANMGPIPAFRPGKSVGNREQEVFYAAS